MIDTSTVQQSRFVGGRSDEHSGEQPGETMESIAARLCGREVSSRQVGTLGESYAAAWLERRGWQNEYHDGTSRDVVDEVISNLQSFTQKLYVNESNLGELVTERIESLKSVNALESGEKRRDENLYETVYERDLDQYSQDGYEDLVYEETEFEIDDDEAGDLARRV